MSAAELYLNANKYASHPKLLESMEDPEVNYDPQTLFFVLLTDDVACADTTDKIELVKLEAQRTAENYHWAGMLDLLALASVLKCQIWSVYPNCNKNVRSLLSGIIKPVDLYGTQYNIRDCNFLFLMWTRDGNIDTTPGLPFQPNHFVPLLQVSVDGTEPLFSEDTDCHTNDEPPLKKMKTESCSSGKFFK